jgi:uncharacterized protein with PQ loop repeat
MFSRTRFSLAIALWLVYGAFIDSAYILWRLYLAKKPRIAESPLAYLLNQPILIQSESSARQKFSKVGIDSTEKF